MLEPRSITYAPTTQEYYSAGCSSTKCGGTSSVSHVRLGPCMDSLQSNWRWPQEAVSQERTASVHSWWLDVLKGRKAWLMSLNFGKTSLASCCHGWVAYLPGQEASTSVSTVNSSMWIPLFPGQSLDPEGHWLFNYLNGLWLHFRSLQLSLCFTKLKQRTEAVNVGCCLSQWLAEFL